jgi:hypothetical protein
VSEAPVLAVGERRGRGGKISGRPRALYAASSSIDARSGLGQGSVQVVGVVALLWLSTCVV